MHVIVDTQSDRATGTVEVKVMDRHRQELGSISTLLQDNGSQKHNGQSFLIKNRQQLIIQVVVSNYYPRKEAFLGKFQVQLQGNVEALTHYNLN